jgi:ATP-dependent RNA helicase DDX19/DBP5
VDPTATLLAATSWDELNLSKEILDGIYDMGFVKPSKIQEWTLPIALKGGSIIGQAQNGSGKTAAFALSMLVATDIRQRCPQGLCICPTRELATQNHDVLQRLGKFTGAELFLAVPQADRPPRSVSAQFVIGTPGKIQDLIKRRVIPSTSFRILVIDEADTMIDEDNQMGPQVLQIKNLLPAQIQVLLFSATWPDHVERFARNMVSNAYRITVQKEDLTLDTITQTFIDVGDDDRKKAAQLSDLYGAMNIGQSIIFVNTRAMAFELAKMMKADGHAVSLICGTQKTGPEKVDVAYRDNVMSEFRSGVTKVLIATDVLARGIDVPAVTLVVNYELPVNFKTSGAEYETYIHRIGRTGRFGLRGVAVNLITRRDRRLLDDIQQHYKCTMKQLNGDIDEMESLLKGLR